ncbi:TPA: Hpt domain-containing protein [Photobacterium damselae]|uniref:Hpt domain-containing protein n=3 Tax=Photobacterium damselae TaxID=38293 RepID=A0A1Q9H3S4_PHODP|nr:Hpt domain-containing protein [Photobacterium damselae]EJN6959905.1 Hpt domain-containing protein [Photobacterium damselae]KAB1511118.1 Hpt domain-containing protein [Photobacterium damselae subsp. damselae]MBE8128784.1 Hpt domain-containing protein [Photobacterium damselae subsp. piscicida]MCG3844536.1 Hpt domain-containing protein [Photobacterium damselae]MCG9777048.1 Hpt domain-containing protein [Photobacterium damselae]
MTIKVNVETVKRLADEVGEDTVSLLFNVFSDELEQYLVKLLAEPSVSDIGEISHSIKSSAASFGADDLALLAQECESRVRQGQDSWIMDHLPELRQMVQGVAQEYKLMSSNEELLNSML